MGEQALPCIVCGDTLRNVMDGDNQPSDGTAFETHGHYGSCMFDPMNGTYLEINICDGCLRTAGQLGRVMLGQDRKQVRCHMPDFPQVPTVVGWLEVRRELVPWHEGLENEGAEDVLMIEYEEIDSDLYPEIEWLPGILEIAERDDG